MSFVLLAALVLTGCSIDTVPQTVFDPGGPVAGVQKDLLVLQLIVVTFIGVVVFGLLIYIVGKFRSKGQEKGMPQQVHGNPRLEMLWTVIPILLLLVLAVPTVQAAFETDPDFKRIEEGEHVVIKVDGRQWFWNFEYPDQGFTTSNEMYIPVGKKILLEMSSHDVVHSFWVPGLAGKMDVFPNRTTRMWIEADTARTYMGQCAEFCGTSHANMRFRVIALNEADFAAWAQSHQQPTIDLAEEARLAGEEIFQKKACHGCHTIDGGPTSDDGKPLFAGNVGPNLTGLSRRQTLGSGIIDYNEANLRKWVSDAPSVKPGSIMPAIKFEAGELDALITYLQGLK
jgi:cytochrome c oxidase subunit 2